MSTLPPDVIHALQTIVGAPNVLTEPTDCWTYGYDNSRKHHAPDAVVFATDHAQVAAVVGLCYAHAIPVTARGRGTGTCGGSVPLRAGVVLSLERMTRIVKIDPANRVIVAEPGVTNQAVQDAAGAVGFFWPPDPTSAAVCTVRGHPAHNAP